MPQNIPSLVLFEIARLQDRPGNLLDEQWDSLRLRHDLLDHRLGQCLAAGGAANEIDRLATPDPSLNGDDQGSEGSATRIAT